ncbi:hypothetical protein GCM10010172_66110 [Paractinoplanes ferrugineus]|uniref:Uncharacterized protein n=1 Tax=Paractinoplanes ferrugineus TaxID=113564 RepID=A0A919J574_9ACTN|nr:hypothetical protein [Actinoplanes ferrugineus]GIE13228.1 hypothetical protein Afe05nite_50680 [Actinoplanes ferrugineus]
MTAEPQANDLWKTAQPVRSTQSPTYAGRPGQSPAGYGQAGQTGYRGPAAQPAPYGYAAPRSGQSAWPPPGQGGYSGRVARGQAPGIGAVILFTTLFGVLGAISAHGRARRAAAMGRPGQKYWVAFAATLGGWTLVSVLLALAMMATLAGMAGTPTSTSSGRFTAAWLEQSIVKDGGVKDSSGAAATPTGATCASLSVDADGVGDWRCLVDFGATDRQAFDVAVGSDGRWVPSRGE